MRATMIEAVKLVGKLAPALFSRAHYVRVQLEWFEQPEETAFEAAIPRTAPAPLTPLIVRRILADLG